MQKKIQKCTFFKLFAHYFVAGSKYCKYRSTTILHLLCVTKLAFGNFCNLGQSVGLVVSVGVFLKGLFHLLLLRFSVVI